MSRVGKVGLDIKFLECYYLRMVERTSGKRLVSNVPRLPTEGVDFSSWYGKFSPELYRRAQRRVRKDNLVILPSHHEPELRLKEA